MPNASDAEVQELIGTYDVRGHFEGLVVLVGPETDVTLHRQKFPRARALAPVGPKHLVAIERQALMADKPEDVQAWSAAAARVLNEAGHSVLLTQPRRILAAVHGDTGRLELLPLPGATEFVPLATRSLRARLPHQNAALDRIRRSFAYRAEISDVIAKVDGDSLVAIDTYLSGEASTLTTRNAYSTQVRDAAGDLVVGNREREEKNLQTGRNTFSQ